MYGKLFSQMYDGTLATKGPWQALVTFQQFIILSDKNGIVDMTADAIARRTTIPLEIIESGIKTLMEPDPGSRSPDEEGRRLVLVSDSRDWGWRVVNYEHYRKIRSEDERREYQKQYMRKRRSVNVKVSKSGQSEVLLTQAVSSMHKALDLSNISKPPSCPQVKTVEDTIQGKTYSQWLTDLNIQIQPQWTASDAKLAVESALLLVSRETLDKPALEA